MHYPARMWNGSRTIVVRSRETLLARYLAIFTVDIRRTILAASPADLWANSQGVMFADGQIWFAPLQGAGIGIFAINRPLPSH